MIYRFLWKLLEITQKILDEICTHAVSKGCKEIGCNPQIEFPISTLGLNCISIGNNFNVRKDFKLRAYEEYSTKKYFPQIIIGNDFYAATQGNVSIINKLYIGDNVTFASRVTVIDHAHGKADYSDIEIPVMKRELSSKGPIVIHDNVWLCEGVVVLGGVIIGKNSIIAANSVVNKNVPPYSLAAGVPAKVIRSLPKQ
jgi:acetyltransferase-like isoleucine patch superfamily enzyme